MPAYRLDRLSLDIWRSTYYFLLLLTTMRFHDWERIDWRSLMQKIETRVEARAETCNGNLP